MNQLTGSSAMAAEIAHLRAQLAAAQAELAASRQREAALRAGLETASQHLRIQEHPSALDMAIADRFDALLTTTVAEEKEKHADA